MKPQGQYAFDWRLPLARAASVSRLTIGRSDTVFCERTQALSSLNETASRIWSVLESTGSCEAAVAQLMELGASEPQARAFVRSVAADWLKNGYFFPEHLRTGEPCGQHRYQIGPSSFELRYFGNADPATGEEVLGAFRPAREHAAARLDVIGRDEVDFLFLGGACLGMHSREETPAIIKAIATEELSAQCETGFLMHGALLSVGGKTIVLAGHPGAGKTTLTLALAASGFDYAGDDIIHVSPEGRVLGLPFAAATKEGAWPLLEKYVPDLMDLPVRRRADDKLVRYVRPANTDAVERGIDFVLLLSRHPGASPRVESIDPVEALCFLLEGSFSQRRRIETPDLKSFAAAIGGAQCGRFTYSDLDPAVAAVKSLVSA